MHCNVSTGNMVLSSHEFCWAQAKFKMFNMKCNVEIERYPNLNLMHIDILK